MPQIEAQQTVAWRKQVKGNQLVSMLKLTTLAYQRCATRQFIPLFIAICLALGCIASLPAKASAKPAFSTIAIDARSGKVLYARNADSYRYPASLTKIMTLYLMFEDLRDGKIRLSTRLKVSRLASKQAPSKLGLKPGRSISVKDAIGALVTKSANDAAVVVAENLSGSVRKFASRMTRKARALGMTRTTFHNPHGLPDKRQKTTARDMATLALRIQRDFPTNYKHFSLRSYRYGKRAYRNHNRLLGRVKGVDGIKTGYTRASGFNLTTSARRNGKRVVAVVMGGRTGRSRNAYMTSLLNRIFRTKRLTKGAHLARVAGTPPGYVKPQSVTKTARVNPPPVPRAKPLVQGTQIASIAHGAAIESLATQTKTDKREKDQSRIPVGATFVAVEVPAEVASGSEGNQGELTKKIALAKGDTQQTAGIADAKPPENDTTITATVAATAKTNETVLDEQHNQVGTNFAKHLRSWNIQIGAFPTVEGAKSQLATAKNKAKRNLSGKQPFTMPTQKNGKTLFRARFSGFSRVSARKACKTLSRRGVGCFALAPKG